MLLLQRTAVTWAHCSPAVAPAGPRLSLIKPICSFLPLPASAAPNSMAAEPLVPWSSSCNCFAGPSL